jgi:hypothetical protein
MIEALDKSRDGDAIPRVKSLTIAASASRRFPQGEELNVDVRRGDRSIGRAHLRPGQADHAVAAVDLTEPILVTEIEDLAFLAVRQAGTPASSQSAPRAAFVVEAETFDGARLPVLRTALEVIPESEVGCSEWSAFQPASSPSAPCVW